MGLISIYIFSLEAAKLNTASYLYCIYYLHKVLVFFLPVFNLQVVNWELSLYAYLNTTPLGQSIHSLTSPLHVNKGRENAQPWKINALHSSHFSCTKCQYHFFLSCCKNVHSSISLIESRYSHVVLNCKSPLWDAA